jgi:hypothetical protein
VKKETYIAAEFVGSVAVLTRSDGTVIRCANHTELAKTVGMHNITLHNRLNRARLPLLEAITRPLSPQSRQRVPVQVVINGVEQHFKSLRAATKSVGACRHVAAKRLQQGYSIEEALGLVPVYGRKQMTTGTYPVDGTDYPSIAAAARAYKRSPALVVQRIRTQGWSLEKAVKTPPCRPKLLRRKAPVPRGPLTVFGMVFRNRTACARYFEINSGYFAQWERAGKDFERCLGVARLLLERRGLWDAEKNRRTDHDQVFEGAE